MKKIVNYLLILLITFIGIRNVNALTDDESIRYSKTTDARIDIANLYTGSRAFWINEYSLTANGQHYVSYCLDPHKTAADYYTVSRILGSESSAIVRAHDYGVLAMLEVGYTQLNNSYETSDPTPETNPNPYVAQLTGTDLYAATNIAIRAYTLGLFGWGGSDNDRNNAFMQTQASSFINMGANWAGWNAEGANTILRLAIPTYAGYTQCTSDGASCQQNIKNFLDEYVYNTWNYNKNETINGYSYGTTSYAIIYAAKEIFDIGMNTALDYLENGRTESGVSAQVINTVESSRDEDEIEEYVYVNLQISDFSDEAYVNNLNITCNGCDSTGSTIDYVEYYIGDNWTHLTLNSTTDLSESIVPDENGLRNGTVRLRIHVTRPVVDDTEDCEGDATFIGTYDYYDPNLQYVGAILNPVVNDVSRQDLYQRMVIIERVDNTGTSGQFTGTIPGCSEMICETQVSIPICSDQEDEAIAEITTDERIKKCILDSEDDAHNSYQLTVENGGVDNDYCQVFCKEDYKDTINDGVQGGLKLNPVVKDVECGGFFQLTSHIEGQKDCYTGGDTDDKRIDREQFIADIIAAQKKMIENYDLYIKATVAMANIDSTSCSCGCCGGGTEWYSSGRYDGVEAVEDADTVAYGYVKIQEKEGSYNYVDSCSGSCSNDPETGCSGSCSSGSRSDLVYEIEEDLEEATTGMSEGYNEYVNAIRAYNGCTAAWDNEYLFSQRLQFYYSEYHYDEEFTPYYDIIAAADNEDLYYLEAQEDTLIEESEVVICKGDTNENYECQEPTVNFDGSLDLNVDEWNYVSDYGNSVYSPKTFTVCDTDGCRDSERMISDATFVRKTVKKSQDYITPTIFYQIEANGRITVNSGYTGNALKLDALINSLPVSSSTTGGGIFKLMIEDLGEFYDTGEVGRLMDFGDDDTNSVAKEKEDQGIETFDGEYTCYYYSPCRPDDCPDCNFICDPEDEDCYWGDPGSCPDCEFDCPNCIFNFDQLQLNFRPISTTNFDSADRAFGYNWDISTSLGALQLLKDKAELTINEIEEYNETIYNKSDDDEDSQLSFSIRMTSDVVNYLKEYNDDVEEEGGYANDSLTCYDATINGVTLANIYCFSDVIDDLIDQYGEQITAPNRPSESGRTDSRVDESSYWTLWGGWFDTLDANNDGELDRDANGQYTVIGGPSWK